jgi:hypothetical protein
MDDVRAMFMAKRFVGIVRAHYQQGPAARERTEEALNALALTVAVVLTAAPDGMHEMFNKYLEEHINEVIRDQEEKAAW